MGRGAQSYLGMPHIQITAQIEIKPGEFLQCWKEIFCDWVVSAAFYLWLCLFPLISPHLTHPQ
jgi:hypothetical protein